MEEELLPTPEEVEAALSDDPNKEPEELSIFETVEEKQIALKLLPGLHKKAMEHAEGVKAKELAVFMEAVKIDAKRQIEGELEKIRKANTPLTPEELQQLVNQEYLEFNVTIGPGNSARTFMLGELTALSEKKLLTVVKKTLGERMKEIAALDWSESQTVLQRVEKLIDMVPGVLETVADCVAICLNPFGDDEEINGAWVLSHLTIQKMLIVLKLQSEANRWRDFFSLASQFIPSQMMG